MTDAPKYQPPCDFKTKTLTLTLARADTDAQKELVDFLQAHQEAGWKVCAIVPKLKKTYWIFYQRAP